MRQINNVLSFSRLFASERIKVSLFACQVIGSLLSCLHEGNRVLPQEIRLVGSCLLYFFPACPYTQVLNIVSAPSHHSPTLDRRWTPLEAGGRGALRLPEERGAKPLAARGRVWEVRAGTPPSGRPSVERARTCWRMPSRAPQPPFQSPRRATVCRRSPRLQIMARVSRGLKLTLWT